MARSSRWPPTSPGPCGDGKTWGEQDDRFVRLDLQYCCATGLPDSIEINGKGSGEVSAAKRHIQSGVIYVADRGIFSYDYVRQILQSGSDLVLRIKKSIDFVSTRQRPRSQQALAAGVLGDFEGHLE